MFGLAGTYRGPGRALVPSLGSGIMTGHRVRRKAQPYKPYSTAGWMNPDPLVLGHPPGWVRVRTQLDEINRYWLCGSSPQLTSMRVDKCKGSSQNPTGGCSSFEFRPEEHELRPGPVLLELRHPSNGFSLRSNKFLGF